MNSMVVNTSKRIVLLACVMVAIGAGIGISVDRLAFAQQPGIKRTILLRADDPGTPNYEAIMGIAELVDDCVDGLLVRPGRIDELVGALTRLAEDPDLRAELGRRGREKVAAQFDSRESGRQLKEIFSKFG